MMLVLTVSYDGTNFAGSQIQPNARTVQGELERATRALPFLVGPTTFASRTDAGVHAAGQVVSSGMPDPGTSPDAARRAINARLPADLAVIAARRAEDTFHPRYDARWREYRYRIWSGPLAPLARNAVWLRRQPLNAGRMAEAASRFEGRRDFASVAGGGEGVPWSPARETPRGMVRTVHSCTVSALEPWWCPSDAGGVLYELAIIADGFLPRMVRNIVELVVEAGNGAIAPAGIDAILEARDRRAGRGTAPAAGLTLWRIGYDEWSNRTAG